MAHSVAYERRRRVAIQALWENVGAFSATLRTAPPDVRAIALQTFEAEAARLLGPGSPLLKEMVRALRCGISGAPKPTPHRP